MAETQQTQPLTLYYDSYGNMIQETWCGPAQSWRRASRSRADHISVPLGYSGEPAPPVCCLGYVQTEGNVSGCMREMKAHCWLDQKHVSSYDNTESTEGALRYYWVEEDVWRTDSGERGLPGGVVEQVVEVRGGGRVQLTRPPWSESSQLVHSVWQGRGLTNQHPLQPPLTYMPDTTHFPSTTTQYQQGIGQFSETADQHSYTKPQFLTGTSHCPPGTARYQPESNQCPPASTRDVRWAWVCGLAGGSGDDDDEWASVGVVGGVWKRQVRLASGKRHQYVGTCVTVRTPHTTPPAASLPHQHTRVRRRHNRPRPRSKHKTNRLASTGQDMKLWGRTGRGGAGGATRSAKCSVSSRAHVSGRTGGDVGGQSSPPDSLTPAGATLPGHVPAAHTLTHIDYDSLRPEWHQSTTWEDAQPHQCSDHVPGHQNVHVPRAKSHLTNTSFPARDGRCLQRGPRQEDGGGSGVGLVEGRHGEGEGACLGLGGSGGQASGTCGALGQTAAPAPPVSARASTRAHTRSRNARSSASGRHSVSARTSGSSRTRERGRNSVGEKSDRCVRESESWPK